MLEERRVVRAAAQISYGHVGLRLRGGRFVGNCSWLLLTRAVVLVRLLPSLIHGTALGARYGFGYVAQKLLQARHCRRPELGARDGNVHVEIRRGSRQLRLVLLHPFGGANQALFFAIPTAEDQRALGPPT